MPKTLLQLMSSSAFAIALLFGGQSEAASFKGGDTFNEHFHADACVSDAELADMRGGFKLPNGLIIDFAITTQTFIDGTLQRQLGVSSDTLAELDPSALNQIIQVGNNNNSALVKEALAELPGIFTVIQNSKDNTLIQTYNQLDLSVQGNLALSIPKFGDSIEHLTTLSRQ